MGGLDKRTVAERNREARSPDLLFAKRPRIKVNGIFMNLLGMNRGSIVVGSVNAREMRVVKNSEIKSFRIEDAKFDYAPGSEDLLDLVDRLKKSPSLREYYGLVANDGEVEEILFGNGTPSIAKSTSVAEVVVVPEPEYDTDRPWDQVALLNPPPPPRRAPQTPPTPPPAIQPPPAPAGFPEWGKYAIAAVGVATIIVFFKK